MYIPMICIYDLYDVYLISTSPLYLHPAGMHLRLYLYIYISLMYIPPV